MDCSSWGRCGLLVGCCLGTGGIDLQLKDGPLFLGVVVVNSGGVVWARGIYSIPSQRGKEKGRRMTEEGGRREEEGGGRMKEEEARRRKDEGERRMKEEEKGGSSNEE